jgi:hypothetical protein
MNKAMKKMKQFKAELDALYIEEMALNRSAMPRKAVELRLIAVRDRINELHDILGDNDEPGGPLHAAER